MMPQQLSYKKVFLSMDCLVWRLNYTKKKYLFIFLYFVSLGELLKRHRVSDFVLQLLSKHKNRPPESLESIIQEYHTLGESNSSCRIKQKINRKKFPYYNFQNLYYIYKK